MEKLDHERADGRWRTVLLAYFPMFIATLSLVTSIYNGYLNNRFVDLIENNVARLEYMRTCKEIIDAYFLVKVRTTALSDRTVDDRGVPASPATIASGAPLAAAEAVAKFGALGTYLANLRDESIRERYTALTTTLEKAAAAARTAPPQAIAKLLESADRDFSVLNDDCVKSAKAQRL